MKLLVCTKCWDIVTLRLDPWRKCQCGACGGQYNYDCITATIGGKCKVIGIANPFLSGQIATMSPEGQAEFRMKYYPEGKGQDVWFGEYEGDVQLIKVISPDGPRVRVSTQRTDSGIILRVHDRRKYWVGPELRRKEVLLPNYSDDAIRLTKKAA